MALTLFYKLSQLKNHLAIGGEIHKCVNDLVFAPLALVLTAKSESAASYWIVPILITELLCILRGVKKIADITPNNPISAAINRIDHALDQQVDRITTRLDPRLLAFIDRLDTEYQRIRLASQTAPRTEGDLQNNNIPPKSTPTLRAA